MITLLAIATHTEKRGPMFVLPHAMVSHAGLLGDHRAKRGSDRQVTVLSREAWNAACSEVGNPDLPWTTRRANLLITGRTFGPEDVGRRLRIGSVVLEITGETDPCSRMDEQVPGLTKALTPDWRGGVTCRVLESGELTPNLEVFIE